MKAERWLFAFLLTCLLGGGCHQGDCGPSFASLFVGYPTPSTVVSLAGPACMAGSVACFYPTDFPKLHPCERYKITPAASGTCEVTIDHGCGQKKVLRLEMLAYGADECGPPRFGPPRSDSAAYDLVDDDARPQTDGGACGDGGRD